MRARLVVLLADDQRRQHARGRVERIHRRIDALFRDRADQHRGGVEMRERGRRRRVGQVVGRHVDRLHRGDRALVVVVMRSCSAPMSVASVG